MFEINIFVVDFHKMFLGRASENLGREKGPRTEEAGFSFKSYGQTDAQTCCIS